jgi:NAD(P)H-quinone oxidoreductase subunit 5
VFPDVPTTTAALPLWNSALQLVPLAAALLGAVASRQAGTPAAAWRLARMVTVVMLAASVAAAVARAATSSGANALVRSDGVGSLVLILVSFVGWAVVRYSAGYLAGDPRARRYCGRLLATLTAVAMVVVTNNLVVLTIAWLASSLAVHGLLRHFGERPVAVAVAHKKFILARLADLSMLGAVVAFGSTYDTLRIDRIDSLAAAAGPLPTGARIGIALVAIAALLKCAQLPFHGWLIQVMEAPTPVSALLHAGLVNLGGFVLLRFAPVVDRAIETRSILVVVGSLTAVIAGIIMTTRVSIKVSLAWSTCAQMGFMLLQCGLGLWGMALLHLVAHSLYKAHAFFGAGGIVGQTQRQRLSPMPAAPTVGSLATGVAAAAATTLAVGWAWGRIPSIGSPAAAVWVMSGILALALVPLLAGAPARPGGSARRTLLVAAVAVPIAYFGLHELFGHVVAAGSAAPAGLLAVVGACFALLFLVQATVAVLPAGSLARRLHPWIFGGLFIDEAFTRVAFALWPPPPPSQGEAPLPQPRSLPVLSWTTPGAA